MTRFHRPFLASIIAVFAFLWQNEICGQNSYENLGSPNYQTIERALILNGRVTNLHTGILPYRRGDVAEIAAYSLSQGATGVDEQRYLRALMDNNEFLTAQVREKWNHETVLDSVRYDTETRAFTIADSSGSTLYAGSLASRKKFIKVIYRTPAHFFESDLKDVYLRVNPLINFGIAKEFDDEDFVFVNQRGIEIRGGVDGKVFFHTNLFDTQTRPPTHYRWYVDQYDAFPNAGLFSNFESSIVDFEDGYDYLSAEGYVGFNISKHVGIHFGHGKNFIGHGYRSLFLSDFSKNYFFLKFNTRVWKFHYQNIFAELAETARSDKTEPFPKKFMAAHYLSFQATDKLSFGLFESVIFDRDMGQFEFQYLNPIIFYRSIEHALGSPDNVLLGFDARWDLWNHFSLYGQLIFDELKIDELLGGNKWWGNKWAAQLGVKYFNVLGVDQLDLQVEYNQVRPFTYSHRDSSGSYAHFNQALAHPMGANLREVVIIGRYVPIDRLFLEAKFFIVDSAEDTDSIYFGTNVLRPNDTRNADFGIEQGQGIGVRNTIISLKASYMLKHNLFFEARYLHRNYKVKIDTNSLNTRVLSVGFRWNLFGGQNEF